MIDQKQGKMFKVENNDHEFIFILDSLQNQISLNIRNTRTEEKFKNRYVYDTLPQLFRDLFKTIEELFTFLSTLPKEKISITSQSNVYALQIILQIIGKNYIIQLPLIQVTDNDAKIKEYQNRLESLCLDNRRLTVELRNAEQKIQRLNWQLRNAKEKIRNLQEDNQILDIRNKKRSLAEIEANVPMLVPSKASYKLALNSTEYENSLRFKEEELFEFVPCIMYSLYFNVIGKKISVICQSKDFHQVVSAEPLSLTQRRIVKMRMNNSQKNNIYFGIMKEGRRKEKYTCQQQQSISYKLCGGKFLWEDGKQSGEETSKIKKGEVLCLIVDPIKKEMTWFVEKEFMFKRQIPNNFVGVPLYPFVSMHDVGDEVEFL